MNAGTAPPARKRRVLIAAEGEFPRTDTLKLPSQKRSRDRLEAILDAARSLLAEKGSDDLKMSDIASVAKISMGSLYQYFPEKAAVIRLLAARYDENLQARIGDVLARVDSIARLQRAYATLIDEFYRLMVEEPAAREIWAGMQGDPELRAIELRETRECSDLLLAAMLRAQPRSDRRAMAQKALLLWSLGGAAARLAIAQPGDEGRWVIENYKAMALRELDSAPSRSL